MSSERRLPRLYVFAGLTLDPSRACLLRDGERVPLRPKAFDALLYLVEHRGRLVTKAELIDALWPKVVVTDDSLVKCIQEVRGALGAELRGSLETVPRRGYIFDAPVEVRELGYGREPVRAPLADEPTDAPLQDGPAINESVNAPLADASADEPSFDGPTDLLSDGRIDGRLAGEQEEGRLIVAPAEARPTDSPPDASTVPRSSVARRAGFAAIVVLGIAASAVGMHLLLGGGDGGDRVSSVTTPERSVAVLPFVSISSEPDQDYFSDGISEELLNVLSNVRGLRVPSRTSSFAFKGTNADLKTIAAALDVDHVLEGSVRKAGDQVRITAQLVDVATDSPIWSAMYERELTNIFAVQDEIAWSVAAALEVELLADELSESASDRTSSTEAHDAYLLGVHHVRTLRSEDILRARASFVRAIELDPSYAAAHAGLASALVFAQGYGLIDRAQALAEAERAATRAVELAPDSAPVRSASATVLLNRGDLAAADAEFRRAIAANPGFAAAHAGRFTVLGRSGRVQEARASLARALELDPLNGQLNWWMGNALLQLGEAEDAAVYFRRGIEFEPSVPNNYSGLGDIAILSGRIDEGLSWYVAGLEQDPGQVHMTSIVGLMYLSIGDPERSQQWLAHAASLQGDEALRRLFRDFAPLIARNERPRELIDLLRDVPPSAFVALGGRLFRKAALATGDVAGAEALFRQIWPQLFNPDPLVDASSLGAATDVAWLALAAGDANRASRLLDKVFEVLEDSSARSIEPIDWGSVMIETEALALAGRPVEALEAFRSTADGGWRFDWWQVERDPALETIRSAPEFAATIDAVKADLAMQLEHVRELERAGEVPVRPEDVRARAARRR